ncbi:uncharacterized protein LOC109851270 [Asparagus officinalis]|uniref:uncharacterized protein LOC109851270 n=1 Tax=Asparagus officinalis TaxID=4686 RepID=UPI00098E25EC|nr:uncharacterized protein LOC109851270 [Asparagus officinalis]
MDSTVRNIPISSIQAFHSRERKLFSRMVIDLCMDPTRSMEIIAFWLWLEEQEQTDIIDHINSLSDSSLQIVALIGRDFVDALRLDTPPDQLAVGFHQNAVNGVKYYLNSVCLKAFSDIQRRAEKAANLHRMEMLVRQMSNTYLQSVDPRQIIPSSPHVMDSVAQMRPFCIQPYIPHGEGTSRGTNARIQPLGILDVERGIQSGYPFNLSMLKQRPLIPYFPQIGYQLPTMTQNINAEMGLSSPYLVRANSQQPPTDNIPMEERTLFVTFSNGYPLTKEELYTFFMRYYGDVEMVNIQKPKEGKPPQYAYVSFHTLATVLEVLNGADKVKFITNGKHLWARRFIPKKNPCNDTLNYGDAVLLNIQTLKAWNSHQHSHVS